MSNPVRESCDDSSLSEEQQVFKNYVQAMQDVEPGRWAALSVEEIQTQYAEGEITDGELEDALEIAMTTPDVEEVEGVFTTATSPQTEQNPASRRLYFWLLLIGVSLLAFPYVVEILL